MLNKSGNSNTVSETRDPSTWWKMEKQKGVNIRIWPIQGNLNIAKRFFLMKPPSKRSMNLNSSKTIRYAPE